MKNNKIIIFTLLAIGIFSGCSKKNDANYVNQNNNQESNFEITNNIEATNTAENQEITDDETIYFIPSNPLTEVPEKIDLDFTKMNYNMASSIMFEMLIEPEKYIDKTVKISGQLETSIYEGNRYFSVINWDLTGCCPSGLNFIPPASMIYPDNFPESSSLITVIGTMKEAFNGKSNELYFFTTSVTASL